MTEGGDRDARGAVDCVRKLLQSHVAADRHVDPTDRDRASVGNDRRVGVGVGAGRRGDLRSGELLDDDVVGPEGRRAADADADGRRVADGGAPRPKGAGGRQRVGGDLDVGQHRGEDAVLEVLPLQVCPIRLHGGDRYPLLLHDGVQDQVEIDVVESAEGDRGAHGLRGGSRAWGVTPHALSLECYPRRDSTDVVEALAWARAAIPLWFRMLNRVRLADSSAMFASRIRLSAARLLTT